MPDHPELLDFLDEVAIESRHSYSLSDDFDSGEVAPAKDLSPRILEKYGVDLTGEYAGVSLYHPFGKAAGQLSLNEKQVISDRDSGLAYTVLKSAVGVTESGEVGIDDWQKSAPEMMLEPRKARDGRTGWTVTWKGRGWDKGFGAYIEFYRESLRQNPGYLVIPSLMVDVTDAARARQQASHCITELFEIHGRNASVGNFVIEIDISPTLFLLPDADKDEKVIEMVTTSVDAFRSALESKGRCVIKLPNASRGAEFQANLAKAGLEAGGNRVAALIVGNRLFDPDSEFKGQRGIAYGGYDLSNANLETLDRFRADSIRVDIAGTGNICSGRMMAEYAIRGCKSGQIHTFFQLPPNSYRAPASSGGRTWRALRELLYHPDDGLISTILKLERSGKLARSNDILRFRDLLSVKVSTTEGIPDESDR